MSKAVLISIQPQWCDLIANGLKTVEVRKTMPKLETPFKCYIYCTLPKKSGDSFLVGGKHPVQGNGKVIGEFICDDIKAFDVPYPAYSDKMDKTILEKSCIRYYDLHRYAWHDCLYAWNISDLVIYDKPKDLSEFRTLCKYRNEDGSCQYRKVECDCVKFDFNPDYSVNLAECCDYMTRPPQSWCYVESKPDNNKIQP